jgi:hypothetical protein
MAILWGPFTFSETDQSTGAPGGQTVKSIPIDFTGFDTGANALSLTVLAGEVQFDQGNFGSFNIILGGTPELYGDADALIWRSDDGFTSHPAWADFPTIISGDPHPTTAFTSPGPGITNLHMQGDAGASGLPAGIRNYTIQIEGPAPSGGSGGGASRGGFGSESYGDPFGVGGPLNVVRARAIQSHAVLVTFDEEPVHASPSGQNDALNPSNYGFTITSGDGTAPQCIGVDLAMVVGPALGVLAGDERGFVVHTDKPLIFGLTYLVTARNIESKVGGVLGSPYAADFPGALHLSKSKPPQRKIDFVDLANSPFGGAFVVDDSGDVTTEGSVTGLRKRMLRRASTPRDAFSTLPGYGSILELKKLASPSALTAARADLQAQILQEPEVQDAQVTFEQASTGVLTVVMRAKTKKGAIVTASLSVDPVAGTIVIP